MFDLVITNGVIVNASGTIYPPNSDIGISDGMIECIGRNLKGSKTIDAHGAYVTPGGIDGHVHLDQVALPDVVGDNFEDGTRSGICGGTTSIVCFAAQERHNESVLSVVEEYHKKAKGLSYCDYGFHLIMTNPTDKIVEEELTTLFNQGVSSVKIYMSYDTRKLSDDQIMKVMTKTRALGMTTLIHAENWDMITLIIDKLRKAGKTDPYYHAVSRPGIVEDEASYRAICMSELLEAPIVIVHVSTKAAAKNIRNAQTRMLPIFAETCPQYLFLKSDKLKIPDFEGAKYICSPPLRDDMTDINALWDGIANGTFTVLSSDHCPFQYDSKVGKKRGLIDGVAHFTEVPNGLPGLETRLVLGYEGVMRKKISIHKFVEVTSYNPSLLYGFKNKGMIAPGYDADIIIWYPDADFSGVTIKNDMLHHKFDYTPYDDIRVGNWPRYTILRGQVVWDRDNNKIIDKPTGSFVQRLGNQLAKKVEFRNVDY